MPLKHIIGVDHVVVAVRDLDTAAATWTNLGFTVSPRGTHSPHIGSANHTIVFSDDYIELLSVLHATVHSQPTVDFLSKREGIERVAFTTDDAAAGVDELKGRGIIADGPVGFGRPVELPGGGTGEARFNIFRWPRTEVPDGPRIFACQHLTPETVWIPELRRHPNGASRLVRVEVLSGTPAQAASRLSRLIEQPVTETPDGYCVASGGTRAKFLFLDATAFSQRYPEAVRAGAAGDGVVAIAIATSDLATARKATDGISHEQAVLVPAARANGVVLSFVP